LPNLEENNFNIKLAKIPEEDLDELTSMNWMDIEVLLPETYNQPHQRFFDHFIKMLKDSKAKEDYFYPKKFSSNLLSINGEMFHK